MLTTKYDQLDVSTDYLPILVNQVLIERTFEIAQSLGPGFPVLSVITGTKPDFYKQAPLLDEAVKQNVPVFVIDTGQHYDELLGHGISEFGIDRLVGCNLQIRGNLVEKATELLFKFAKFGRICKSEFPHNSILPIVHGDTLVAGITPLSWLFGMGQKVAQNEAGLRSMSPLATKSLRLGEPTAGEVEQFVNSQLEKKSWFLAREEPFPEQVDTWICSAGTQYFFAPTKLNFENLVREGYPEENIYVVGNSVVDAIKIKRKTKPKLSIFDVYPELVTSASKSTLMQCREEWIRVDIHRRENLTRSRFFIIIESLVRLVKMGYKIILIKLTATEHALMRYGLADTLNKLAAEYPYNFIQTPLWKEYGHVVEFLDSGSCWLELTDSGSMQEELLYFPKVNCITVRLNTDRPETVFAARGNILTPPIDSSWIVDIVRWADQGKLPNSTSKQKNKIYGEPGTVSRAVIKIIKRHFEEDHNFFPWLHNRLRLSKETDLEFSYL